jgi:putative ABC transport system ATP-binding protein
MPAENILEVHHLKKSVGQGEHQLSILTGVELVVKQGQTIALIGESGSGKSTLLAILAGLDDGSSGEVSLLGKPLHQMDEEARAKLRAKHVGFVFQSFMLIPTLNALENVELPALLRGESDNQSRGSAGRCWSNWGWANACITCRYSFPAASSSGSRGARV